MAPVDPPARLDMHDPYYREKFYTRYEVDRLLRAQADRLGRINRVIQETKETDIALQIVAIHKLQDGILVRVR